MNRRVDYPGLVGKRFGRWLVVEYLGRNEKKYHKFRCRCDCGVEKDVIYGSLTSGLSTSCGCYNRELPRTGRKTHGKSFTRAHHSYEHMMQRCYNPNNPSYLRYGGRGIGVCDRWRNEIQTFFDDMGDPPEGMTLGRIDNNDNYSPDNCRWETPQEQANNRRSNVWITFQGKTLTAAQWARLLGFNQRIVEERIRRGWTVEEALLTPPRRSHSIRVVDRCTLLSQQKSHSEDNLLRGAGS